MQFTNFINKLGKNSLNAARATSRQAKLLAAGGLAATGMNDQSDKTQGNGTK